MSPSELPCLSLAIERLRASQAQHFAIHVIEAPYRGGYLLRDCLWTDESTHHWRSWQEMFSSRGLPNVPHVSQVVAPPVEALEPPIGQPLPRSTRLMQNLGINLWQWLFDGVIQGSLNRSQGIAQGQNKALRLRLDVRDPELISLPWEIMQSDAGKQAISLSQQLLFSRTTSDVDGLPALRSETSLNVLLVLGQDAAPDLPSGFDNHKRDELKRLKLEQEAIALSRILRERQGANRLAAPCFVDTLLQPTSGELIDRLENGHYNVLFYAGHGVPAADGGLLFLRPNQPMNGTELAQVLTRCRVKLAVFNACWGAQPEDQGGKSIPRSSLAEVLLHHGVPAVLAMRDSITDEEALSFIATFAQALTDRMPIDQAVAVARQHLLTLFRFNHQAWTLPVLYMHPEFNGELIKPIEEGMTQIPHTPSQLGLQNPVASLRSLENSKVWTIRGGIMKVGMSAENDLVLANEPGVSRRHAEIIYRSADQMQPMYILRDFSRYGTWVSTVNGWQKVHNYEVPLYSGAQIKFGGSQNSILEFLVSPADGRN
ncbi:CHAT domain-containing protein [Leptolyngbya sp. NIES-2104]|uniref:CHAT domain-containing protein n=1 Tax=Leptolyngbya sp. NIES-2104 TaxID=1552121 RepID=UPI0006ECB366|nr:CHAT domain-containing protein [Leptolyngbya sp. NIES-2104]GAP97948.1 FHA domain containing protein [Leptolyngbya sp. NIES-2104]